MRTLRNANNGFTLVELLIAMVIGIMVLAGIYAAFNSQQKSHVKEQQVVDAQQNVRGAAHFMAGEIRLAGMDEKGTAGAGFLIAGPHAIQFTMDRNDDEDVADTDENIAYGFSAAADADFDGRADAGAAPIARFASSDDEIAEDIHAVAFAYAFDDDGDGELDFADAPPLNGLLDAGEETWAYDLDGDGLLDTNNDGSGPLAVPVSLAKIRAVRIWLLARTRSPLRGYAGPKSYSVGDKTVHVSDSYQYRLLTTTVKCRNMGL
ncbi:MAG: PilW family protein [Desulfobacterales bacterium]|nr:MAG: PilW family protein [Desulfobacterales bacterium]